MDKELRTPRIHENPSDSQSVQAKEITKANSFSYREMEIVRATVPMKACFPFFAAEIPEAESGKTSRSECIGNIHGGDISPYGMITSSLLPTVHLARHAAGKKKPDGHEKSVRLEANYVLLEDHFDCKLNAAVISRSSRDLAHRVV